MWLSSIFQITAFEVKCLYGHEVSVSVVRGGRLRFTPSHWSVCRTSLRLSSRSGLWPAWTRRCSRRWTRVPLCNPPQCRWRTRGRHPQIRPLPECAKQRAGRQSIKDPPLTAPLLAQTALFSSHSGFRGTQGKGGGYSKCSAKDLFAKIPIQILGEQLFTSLHWEIPILSPATPQGCCQNTSETFLFTTPSTPRRKQGVQIQT